MDKDFLEYFNKVDDKYKDAFIKTLKIIDKNIPKGFEKGMQFGFPSYFVPLSIYPKGYRCNSTEPLPFLAVGVQKNFISIYHMGIYADKDLLIWFKNEYPKYMTTKLNMGKSCIRFSNPKTVPYKLVGELVSKITVGNWIEIVEKEFNN